MRAAGLALGVLLAGCALRPLPDAGFPQASKELADTPFFPQAVNECGPAALATALAASGVTITPDALGAELYLPGRKGSLQPEVTAATRRHERVPYPVPASLPELLATVVDGTPVLVLQNLGLSWWPQWHYAVVVGYDAGAQSVVLRSGTEKRKVEALRAFDRAWSLADRWAIAVVPPGAPPARAELRPWLVATSPFEELQQYPVAATAYEAATQRWPDQALAWQALANARYRQHDLPGAEESLRRALRLEPAAATLNNLASVLLERGCPQQASDALSRASSLPATDAERAVLQRTRQQVDTYPGPRHACAAVN